MYDSGWCSYDTDRHSSSVTFESVSFKYDPFGRRIYKSSSAATSIYAYDGDNLVEETNASGTAVARYSQGLNIDEPLAMLRSSATSYYNADGLGTITSLANTAGSVAQTYTFDSFGNQTASSGSLTNPFQYTARENDPETGLYYYRARYYDSTSGRFLTDDPEGFNAGVNFYAYVLNNPADYTDPFGLDVIVCFFPEPAQGFGHVGFGFPGEPYSIGFYPNPNSERKWGRQAQRLNGPGGVFPDVGDGPRVCKWIHTTPDQDHCMMQKRIERLRNPGDYNVATRQCTGFVQDSLKGCGIPSGSSDPRPKNWFPTLPGSVIPNLPQNAPLPRSAPQ